jgi:arylsulfatase
MYFAPVQRTCPHHVPAEWRDKYKGKFDQGWDKVREETLARQINLANRYLPDTQAGTEDTRT